MILLRRLNGTELGVNADLIERVESNPDTVLTLVDGTKYVVAEPSEEVVALIIEFRARILVAADRLVDDEPEERSAHGSARSRPVTLRLVDETTAGADAASTAAATTASTTASTTAEKG